MVGCCVRRQSVVVLFNRVTAVQRRINRGSGPPPLPIYAKSNMRSEQVICGDDNMINDTGRQGGREIEIRYLAIHILLAQITQI